MNNMRDIQQAGQFLASSDAGLSMLVGSLQEHFREMKILEAQLQQSLKDIELAYAEFRKGMDDEIDAYNKQLSIVQSIVEIAHATGSEALCDRASIQLTELIQNRPRPMQEAYKFANRNK